MRRHEASGEAGSAERGSADDGPRGPVARAAATASSVRRPPATSTEARSPTVADDRRDRLPRASACPVRAPSRSTTWSQRAPASTNAVATATRIVSEGGLALEVALLEAHDATAAKVDRRQDLETACHMAFPHASVLARYNAIACDAREVGPARWPTTGGPPTSRRCFKAMLRLETLDETERFFRDLCTLNELRDMAQRWAVVRMLDAGLHYAEISRETGASTATITRIASWLNHGEGGYRAMLDQARRRVARRNAPLPGRQASDDPSPAPRRPQQGPAGRADPAAAARCRPRLRGARPEPRRARPELRPRHPVRPDQRRHRVRRRRRRRPRHHRRRPAGRDRRRAAADPRSLGYGRCRLAAAVPNDTPVPGRRGPAGLRVATAHPNTPVASSRSAASPSRSSRSRARSRSRHGSGWPRRSSTSSRPARRW